MIWILKRDQFYTVSEKRLANLHFFVKKWLNMTLFFVNFCKKLYISCILAKPPLTTNNGPHGDNLKILVAG